MLNKFKSVIRESELYNRIVFIKNLRGRLYDLRHNIETAGDARLEDLNVNGADIGSSAEYVATDAKAVKEVFENFRIEHERFTFIDLGSGKGRVLFIASDYPYKRIVGVEFAEELHETAQKNIRTYRSKNRKCRDIEAVCLDATRFEFPAEPLVIFLFNPFRGQVLQKVIKNIEDSLEDSPREIYILYMAAFDRHLFDESVYFTEITSDSWHILYQSVRRS
jgi:SAM-dependent methyltransferase